MRYRNRFIWLLMVLFFVSCSKNKDKDEQEEEAKPDAVLTEDILMNSGPNAVRLWKLMFFELKYLNAAGGIDSTVQPRIPGSGELVRFGKNPNNGDRVYGLDSETGNPVLGQILPGTGLFTLTGGGKILEFRQHPFFPDDAPGGTFDVILYDDLNLYVYGLDITNTRDLPGGRKVLQSFSLGALF